MSSEGIIVYHELVKTARMVNAAICNSGDRCPARDSLSKLTYSMEATSTLASQFLSVRKGECTDFLC